jgi:GH15 family glucan-1,4-alpha-glucosidase
MELGYIRESEAFLKWLLRAAKQTAPGLHVVYDEEGGICPPEQTIKSLRGYQGVGPVHVGNGATSQRQLDIYGEVIVTAATFCEHGGQLSASEKQLLSTLARTVCDNWRMPDAGLWEVRAKPRHNTHSKVMCWVALDRILRLQASTGLDVDAARVRQERDAIWSDIEAHGRSSETGGYVGHYGAAHPDASLLLLPRFGYAQANDTAMIATVRHIRSTLTHQGLLYRYPPGEGYDGVSGHEQLFVICSFWLVDCLSRQGQHEQAKDLFDKLLSLRTPAALYAEELDSDTLRPVGNLPQAFSHVGLITAALALKRFGGLK